MTKILPEHLDEIAARADAAQKVAIIALQEAAILANAAGRPIDLVRLADELESHPLAESHPIERRGRSIASGLIRTLADLFQTQGYPRR